MTKRHQLSLFCAAALLAFGPLAAHAGQQGPIQPTRFVTQTDRLIVRYKDAVDNSKGPIAARAMSAARQALLARAGQQFGATLRALRATANGADVLQLNRSMTLDEARQLAAELMMRDPNVEYAEPDRIMVPLFDAERPDVQPAVGLLRSHWRPAPAGGLGQVDRQRRQRGRDRHRLPSARRPGRPDPAGL
jgi:hypothetical protein